MSANQQQQRMQQQQQPPYIGSKISLISKLDIRYEGTLYTVDAVESTIALAKVHSYGTEDRRTPLFVQPRDEVYDFIIFKASDIKDLIVCEPPKATGSGAHGAGLPYDPAIVAISKNPPPEPKLPIKLSNLALNENKPAYQQQRRPFESFVTSGGGIVNGPDPNAYNETPVFNYRCYTPKYNNQNSNNAVSGRTSRETVGASAARSVHTEQQQRPQHQPFYFQTPQNAHQPHHQQQHTPLVHMHNTNYNQQQQMFVSGTQFETPSAQQRLKFDSDYDFEKANEQFREEINEELKQKLDNVELSKKSPADTFGDAVSEKHHIVNVIEQAKSAMNLKEMSNAGNEWVVTKMGEQQHQFKEEPLEKVISVDDLPAKFESDDDNKMVDLLVGEEGKENTDTFYNKDASFFDCISCDALEKEAGKNVRPDWKRERQTNQETFGQSAVRALFLQHRGTRGFGGMPRSFVIPRNNYNVGGGGTSNYNNYRNYAQPSNHFQPQLHQRRNFQHYQPQQQQHFAGGIGTAFRRN